MLLSIQVQLTDPLPNLVDQMCQEVGESSSSVENINPDINLDFKENSPFQEGVISENISKTRQITLPRPKRIRQSHKHREFDSKLFTKTGRCR